MARRTGNVGWHEQSVGRIVLEELLESCGPRERRPLPVLDWTLTGTGCLIGTVPDAMPDLPGRPIYHQWRDRWHLTEQPDLPHPHG